MKLSAFTRCGHLSLSGARPYAAVLYEELITAYGPAYFPGGVAIPGTYMEAKVFSTAMALARAHSVLVRAGNQRHPNKVWDLILLLAADWGVTPSASDTIPSLQAKIAAAKLLPRGARFEAVVAGLRAILGANLLSYRPLATNEASAYPVWPSAQARLKANPTLPVALVKWCALADPVGQTGTPISVTYTNLDPTSGEVDLAEGDVLMVQPENTTVSERVIVTSVVGGGIERNPPLLPFWTASAAHATGDLVEPVPANGYAYVCTVAGTAGAVQPTWPTMPGRYVVDGSATWTCTGTQVSTTGEDVVSPAAWTPSTLVPVALLVQPTAHEDILYFTCTEAGLTGPSEPIWPTMAGESVQDGSTVWTCQGYIGSTQKFTATFQYAHDVGATLTTMSWPYQWSTQRLSYVVVQSTAALNPELRRQVNEFMAKAVRGVSQWAIVEPSSVTALGGTAGPFVVGSSAIGATPLAAFNFNDVP